MINHNVANVDDFTIEQANALLATKRATNAIALDISLDFAVRKLKCRQHNRQDSTIRIRRERTIFRVEQTISILAVELKQM